MTAEAWTEAHVLRALASLGIWGALLMVASAIAYGITLLIASRREPFIRRRPRHAVVPDGPEIVFLLPCLNEAAVIGASVRRLLDIGAPRTHIMVIDDGSDDGTAAVVEAIGDPRAEVLRRVLPDARRGKGEALNHALTVVEQRFSHLQPDDLVIGVVDADGRLDPTAVADARLAFSDPYVGAVQMGVRINNRFDSLLARMQDMEFVVFTEVFQRGRRHLGSVGMGGNAQFVRKSALDVLGPRPWSHSLTEDFDLGVRLNGTRWTNEFCSTSAVHQEGVTNLRRYLRQRTRWFQGNLQSLGLMAHVLRTQRGRGRADTLYQILTPYLLLSASLLTVSFTIAVVAAVIAQLQGADLSWWWLAVAYLLAWGPSLAYGAVYWRIERREGLGLLRNLAYSHLFVLYGMLAYISGWRAVGRAVTGRTGWAKTAREAEPADEPLPEAAAATPSFVPEAPPPPPPASSVPALVGGAVSPVLGGTS